MKTRIPKILLCLLALLGLITVTAAANPSLDSPPAFSMNNILVKTNQPVDLSYTISAEYQDQLSFVTASEADSQKVTFSQGSDGIWQIHPTYGKNKAGEVLEIHAMLNGSVAGSCQVCFIPSVSTYNDGVEYSLTPGGAGITTTSTRIPFATATPLYASWNNKKLIASGVEALVNATVSRWDWTVDNPEALSLEVSDTDSAVATLCLYQAAETPRVCAKPWLNIDGVDYLYNYPQPNSDDMGITADPAFPAISCSPDNIYESWDVTLQFHIQDLPGYAQDIPVTWSCSNPEILPINDKTSSTFTTTTQKGYISGDYTTLTITATAQVGERTLSGSCSLMVWLLPTQADVTVHTLQELQEALLSGYDRIGVAATISLPEGTNLDLGGAQLLRDSALSGPMFLVEGQASITDSTGEGKLDGDRRYSSAPLIQVEAPGRLNLEQLTLCNSINTAGEGGAIRVLGGSLICKNVNFYDNSARGSATGANDYQGGGCIYAMNGYLEITGCRFERNQAIFGNGGAIYADQGTNGILDGNTFLECTANGAAQDGSGVGGGVYCRLVQDVEIRNNTISSCHAYVNGGGIAIVVSPEGLSGDVRTAVTLSGNTISSCSAENRGGGLYLINSLAAQDSAGQLRENTCIRLLSGTISGCTADWGGGIDYSGHGMNPLFLTNVIIRTNQAVRGGGLWACPTSETVTYSTLGGAIYGNHASGAYNGMQPLSASGDDVRYEGVDADQHREDVLILQRQPNWASQTSIITVQQRALGGGLVQWYQDEQNQRYTLSDSPAPSQLYTMTQTSFSLHGELLPAYQALAEEAACLVIQDNSAETRGGGIATNSQIVMGLENQDKTVSVTKVWQGDQPHPDTLAVTLIRVDEENHMVPLETVLLSEDNGWQADFYHLPGGYLDEDGKLCSYTYTVEEASPEGWTGTCTTRIGEDGTILITLTNQPVIPPTGSLTISKTVSSSAGQTDSFRFTVVLKGPDGAELDAAFSYSGSSSGTLRSGGTVTLRHGESITITGIPAGSSYVVTEAPVPGYTATSTGSTGTIVADQTAQAVFVNHWEPSTEPTQETTPEGTTGPQEETTPNPSTGDTTPLPLMAALWLLSGFMVLLVWKKKHTA